MAYAGPLSLLTDLYELTMMQGYYSRDPGALAVFELFYRRNPFDGGYAVFCGAESLVRELEEFRFSDQDLAYLSTLGMFREDFLRYLSGFSFQGGIFAVPEGTVIFPNEPVLRIRGTLMEAQLVESLALNMINYQTLIATKTSRIVRAAAGKPVLEFGLRRAHGPDGAISASRASYIGGASSTSNTLAGRLFGIPVSGTMAHSWVMSFPSEIESFREYARLYPERCVLLVDTFNTLKSGVPNAIRVFAEMGPARPGDLRGIRIDSGDFGPLSRNARAMLDSAGLADIKIFVSGDMDENTIDQLTSQGAPVDAWGVGTRLVTAWDDPALTGVYKIAARSSSGGSMEPCIKISDQDEKTTSPGAKNITRFFGRGGLMICDLVHLEDESSEIAAMTDIRSDIPAISTVDGAEPAVISGYDRAELLLGEIMRGGASTVPFMPLDEIRMRRERGMNSLGGAYRRLRDPKRYMVRQSERLWQMKQDLLSRIRQEYAPDTFRSSG